MFNDNIINHIKFLITINNDTFLRDCKVYIGEYLTDLSKTKYYNIYIGENNYNISVKKYKPVSINGDFFYIYNNKKYFFLYY